MASSIVMLYQEVTILCLCMSVVVRDFKLKQAC